MGLSSPELLFKIGDAIDKRNWEDAEMLTDELYDLILGSKIASEVFESEALSLTELTEEVGVCPECGCIRQ